MGRAYRRGNSETNGVWGGMDPQGPLAEQQQPALSCAESRPRRATHRRALWPPSPSGCMRMLNKYVKASNFLELARSQLLLTTTCLNLEGVRRRRSFFCTKAQEEFCPDGPCYLHEDLWPLWRWRARSCSRANVDGKRCR